MDTSKKHSALTLSKGAISTLLTTTLFGVLAFLYFNYDSQAPSPTATVLQESDQDTILLANDSSTEKTLTGAKKQDTEDKTNPFESQELKARFQQIAHEYETQLKHPPFSQPIHNETALRKYLPNRTSTSNLTLDPQNELSPRIHLKTDKYQYFEGEKITATASVSNVLEDSHIQFSGKLIKQGQTIAKARIIRSEDPNQATLEFEINTPLLSGKNEMLVGATFRINGENREVTAPIMFTNSVASVFNVRPSEVQNEYLNIPVEIQTSRPGPHAINAILYSATTGEALIRLSAQKNLVSENDFISLTAHISALKEMGDQGPYLLKNISLKRSPSAPNFSTGYGTVTQDSFEIDGHTFDAYEDIPYHDEEALARLDFLKQLGELN